MRPPALPLSSALFPNPWTAMTDDWRWRRFGAEMSSEFFKRLFASVNKVRI